MSDTMNLSPADRQKRKADLLSRYREFKARGLSLDMTRGKPCPEQLDLAAGMLHGPAGGNFRAEDGTDCRNYGGLDGLPEAKRLFSAYLEVVPEELIIGGNSSLALMHDTLVRAMLRGMADSPAPWGSLPEVKFICPSPGYDRHFSICEYLNIKMIPVDLDENGPDMEAVEAMVAEDASIKGMWCTPKYSNPSGTTYSDEVVDRLAAMPAKAADFTLLWDNAYAVHHLSETPDRLKNILSACKKAGNPERPYIFGSTSKVSIAGSGLAMMAGSRRNMEFMKKQLAARTIGPDKLNQLRHVAFFRNMAGIEDHMKKHAAILKPKFAAVDQILQAELGGKKIAAWSRPNGGYFISIDTPDGCAKAVGKMAADAGVKLTPAGATFPYGKDPRDRNIRIAPTFPPLDQVKQAMELVAVCIQLASLERLP